MSIISPDRIFSHSTSASCVGLPRFLSDPLKDLAAFWAHASSTGPSALGCLREAPGETLRLLADRWPMSPSSRSSFVGPARLATPGHPRPVRRLLQSPFLWAGTRAPSGPSPRRAALAHIV